MISIGFIAAGIMSGIIALMQVLKENQRENIFIVISALCLIAAVIAGAVSSFVSI